MFFQADDVLRIHQEVIRVSGGSVGLRERSALESAIAQPFQGFGDEDHYPTLVAKAAALGYFLIQNHPFVDGNKRVGHAAMSIFLNMNGYDIESSEYEQELMILSVAASEVRLPEFTKWLSSVVVPMGDSM
jgi:death-on-curing protein